MKKILVSESLFKERLELKNFKDYAKLVAKAYDEAQVLESNAVRHWKTLVSSNNTLFKRLLSKVEVIFISEGQYVGRQINILGKKYTIEKAAQPYDSASQMVDDYRNNNRLYISADFSDHPVFSLEENIMFRTVHDFIVHILGGHPFGLHGEIASYNRHSKLAPPDALPALFTEIVGQVCYHEVFGRFPTQKVAILGGFDYRNIGRLDGYDVKNKELVSIAKNQDSQEQ